MERLLETGLAVAGWSLVALCVGSLWIPQVLGWRDRLRGLPPLMREMWWTYSAYVWASHAFFAVLALGFGDWLMGGSGAATAMSSFMYIWWAVRLWLQFFGFDLSEAESSRGKRVAKHLLTALFIGLVALNGALVAWNIGWLRQWETG